MERILTLECEDGDNKGRGNEDVVNVFVEGKVFIKKCSHQKKLSNASKKIDDDCVSDR